MREVSATTSPTYTTTGRLLSSVQTTPSVDHRLGQAFGH